MIVQPSQYQIDNKDKDDIVYFVKRPFWYKLYRKYFLKNLNKVKIKLSYLQATASNAYIEQYQEDCVIIHDYEYLCQQIFINEIEYTKNGGINGGGKKYILPKLAVTLYNMQITLDTGQIINLPLNKIKAAMEKNEEIYNQLDIQKQIDQSIKFLKYKPQYFKDVINKRHIKQYIPMYCNVCGKPVKFKFNKQGVKIENNCNCGGTVIEKESMTYNEFAIWFASQTQPILKQRLEQFWLKEENQKVE